MEGFLGSDIYNDDFLNLVVRYFLNLSIAFLIIYMTYYRHSKKSEYTFTFFVFNTMVFMICYMMASTKLSMGFAFGLFAIFSVLRYRTDPIPIKEMTYLLIVIAVGVVNAISSSSVSYVELGFIDFIILSVTYIVESIWHKRQLKTLTVRFKSEGIRKNEHNHLKQELIQQTGLNIQWFEIKDINLSKGLATIIVYYKENTINE